MIRVVQMVARYFARQVCRSYAHKAIIAQTRPAIYPVVEGLCAAVASVILYVAIDFYSGAQSRFARGITRQGRCYYLEQCCHYLLSSQ